MHRVRFHTDSFPAKHSLPVRERLHTHKHILNTRQVATQCMQAEMNRVYFLTLVFCLLCCCAFAKYPKAALKSVELANRKDISSNQITDLDFLGEESV